MPPRKTQRGAGYSCKCLQKGSGQAGLGVMDVLKLDSNGEPVLTGKGARIMGRKAGSKFPVPVSMRGSGFFSKLFQGAKKLVSKTAKTVMDEAKKLGAKGLKIGEVELKKLADEAKAIAIKEANKLKNEGIQLVKGAVSEVIDPKILAALAAGQPEIAAGMIVADLTRKVQGKGVPASRPCAYPRVYKNASGRGQRQYQPNDPNATSSDYAQVKGMGMLCPNSSSSDYGMVKGMGLPWNCTPNSSSAQFGRPKGL